MANRLFIGLGTWTYQHEPHLNLPAIKDALDKVTCLFTKKLGYTQALKQVSGNASSDKLRKTLDRWFAASDRNDSEWIVLYYTGHGKLDASGELYLLTSDYKSNFTPSTSFPAREIGGMLVSQNSSGEIRRTQRFLLILDTCFSGAVIPSFVQSLRARFEAGGTSPMFSVIASALPADEATVGSFATALVEALDAKSVGGIHQEFIYLDELVPAINQRLKYQKAHRLGLEAPDEPPYFFPNPRWVPQAPAGATVAEVQLFIERGEYVAHWNPVARGVEFATQTGDFFTGRQQIIADIAAWFHDSADHRICILTGAPGSGKSAILSRIIGYTRDEVPKEFARNEGGRDIFQPGDFDLAIHGKGKTLDDVLRRLGQTLEVPAEGTTILNYISDSATSFHLLLDALDEAREPGRLASELLRPLSMIPGVKILVGTRKEWITSFGSRVLTLTADADKYLSRDDLARYVEARIGSSKARRALAQAVAESAYPNFLIARLVSEDLLSRRRLPKLSELRLPASVSQAFDQYFRRFGADEMRVRSLLTPLAWAEGGGLPWSALWVPIVNALASGEPHYTDADIEWLMNHAGSFIVETLEKGRSVYRLYHQALADHIRAGRSAQEAQRAIVNGVLTTIPTDGSQ